MKNKKIDRILEAVHRYWDLLEDAGGGMVANAPGIQGGFSASADTKGPVAGYSNPLDPVAGYSNPLDLRTRETRKWNIFFRNLASKTRRKKK